MRGDNGLLRCARNDGVNRYISAFPRRDAPEVLKNHSPRKLEGAGNVGCSLHPRSRVQKGAKSAHEHTGTGGGIPTFPAQWFDGLWRALPGDEFVLSPSLTD